MRNLLDQRRFRHHPVCPGTIAEHAASNEAVASDTIMAAIGSSADVDEKAKQK
jgi:hypothetical protein